MVDPYPVINYNNGSEETANQEKHLLLTVTQMNMNPSSFSIETNENNFINELSGNAGLRNAEQIPEPIRIMCGPSTTTSHGTESASNLTKTNDGGSDISEHIYTKNNLSEELPNAIKVPVIFQNGISNELAQNFSFVNETNNFTEQTNLVSETVDFNETKHLSSANEISECQYILPNEEVAHITNPVSSSSTGVINVVSQETRLASLQEINNLSDGVIKASESRLSENIKFNHKYSVSSAEMDARKVEPLRININRDSIKTKIKLTQNQSQTSQERQASAISPTDKFQVLTKQSSSDEIDHANIADSSQSFPKITIKPIVKPSSNAVQQNRNDDDSSQSHYHHHHQHHHHHYHHQSNHHPQEAIPKLKIKVDPSSACNKSNSSIISQIVSSPSHSDDDQQPQESYIVPKLTIRSTINTSSAFSSGDSGGTNEIVPKFTIKRDSNSPHHFQQINSNFNSTNNKEINLISDEGVKVKLKPISEPPLPKLTIKTNTLNETAEVIKVTNTHHSPTISSSSSSTGIPKLIIKAIAEPIDETNDEQSTESESPDASKDGTETSSPPEHYTTQNISSTTSSRHTEHSTESTRTNCVGNTNASGTEDIKLIIKSTSTGNCVINAATSSLSGMSAISSHTREVRQHMSLKTSSKANSVDRPDQTQANSNETIPKLNIKISSTHSTDECLRPFVASVDEKVSRSAETKSPVPKLTIRPIKAPEEESIVIPKVTIKPLINPNDDSDVICVEQPLITPKIILKPIPKPIDKTQQPLEIITTAPSSPFKNHSAENESQQSPRIILKINKNATSQTKEAIILTKPSTSISFDASVLQNDTHSFSNAIEDISATSSLEKLTASTPNEPITENFELDVRICERPEKEDDDVVQLLSSDSEHENSNGVAGDLENEATQNLHDENTEPGPINSNAGLQPNSELRSILTHSISQSISAQLFMQNMPPKTSDNENSDVIDLCTETNDSSSRESFVNTTTTEKITSSLNATETTSSASNSNDRPDLTNMEQNPENKSKPRWSFLYSIPEIPQPIHPLVQQNIERANVLEAMMNAANKDGPLTVSHNTSNGNNNNDIVTNEQYDFLTKRRSGLFFENDGSSSDCIVIEDTNSVTNFTGVTQEANVDRNEPKKESVDRDSGVDVSSSVKSILNDVKEDGAPPAKRPRGRPRKDGTPAKSVKKPKDNSKRKFAGVLIPQHNAQAETGLSNSLVAEALAPIYDEISNNMHMIQQQYEQQKEQDDETENTINVSETITATIDINKESPVISAAEFANASAVEPNDLNNSMSDSTIEATIVQTQESIERTIFLTDSATDTPILVKERKRRIIIDDDDESPTFNPLNRSAKRMRGRGRGSRGRGILKRKMNLLQSPEKAADLNVFTSPEGIENRRKIVPKDVSTPGLQVFEEDTRMSADSLFTSPNRTIEFIQNEESQSSLHSSTSATIEGPTIKKHHRSKIEVVDPEGKTEFTVDMIAEYDWPPPKGCCPARNRDTYMIQEQIAEYLGVKSFKRKYPDLPRRMVEMEERNYLMEKGLVSEKMCDLGLTAVLASDVLDIMHNDFYEKYEEYRKYLREKQIRDLAARHKHQQAEAYEKNLSARENAIRAASSWNSNFNKSRKENRRECLDLQTFTVQVPEPPNIKSRPVVHKSTNYPVALVPGQFQEYYRTYSAAELLCYPINTVLADPIELDRKIRAYYNRKLKIDSGSDSETDDDASDSCTSSDASDYSTSSDDSDSSSDSSSFDDEDVKPILSPDVKPIVPSQPKCKSIDKEDIGKCKICHGSQRLNKENKPEIFVECSVCQREVHPSCINMSSRMVKRVNEYAWQCKDCKYCIKCRKIENEDKMVFCEQCGRGYHIYCIGLRKIPIDPWHCSVCTVCTMCGARRPEGHNNPNLTPQQKLKLLAVAKWTHEYQINNKTQLREHSSMLCTSCVALKNSVVAKNVYLN